MNDPVIEKIAKKIFTTISSVTTGNGYNYTLTVERKKRWENKPEHLKCVLSQMPPQPVTGEAPLKAWWRQPFMLDIFVAMPDTPENADTSPDEIMNRVCADVEKALMADRQVDIDGVKYAIDTEMDGWDDFSTIVGDYMGREFTFTVEYRTNELNPYQVG